MFCRMVECRILDGDLIISSDFKLNKIQINPKFGSVRQLDRACSLPSPMDWTTGAINRIGACFTHRCARGRVESLRESRNSRNPVILSTIKIKVDTNIKIQISIETCSSEECRRLLLIISENCSTQSIMTTIDHLNLINITLNLWWILREKFV